MCEQAGLQVVGPSHSEIAGVMASRYGSGVAGRRVDDIYLASQDGWTYVGGGPWRAYFRLNLVDNVRTDCEEVDVRR